MELSEDELIAAIARLLSDRDADVVIGLGDDAAVLRSGSGQLVLTTDLLVEGVHFELGSISARDLGAKAITVNVSDVAAMGGSPRAAVASVGLSEDVDAAWAIELTGGMRDACAEYALALVGGDTNRSGSVIVSVAVMGEVAPGRAVARSGARPGDAVVVTGSLGAAAAGLRLSRADARTASAILSEPWGRELADALARPVARVGEAQTLAQAGATAMMDLSDGLAKDLSRLCRASGVGVRLELDRVPVSAAVRSAAAALSLDPLEVALGGGEDYELLATLHPDAVDAAASELRERFGVTLTPVGTIIEGGRAIAVGTDSRERTLEPTGWDHFA